MLGLVLLLWLIAYPMAYLPAPIGNSASLFSEGARITIMLTLISGLFGLVIGVVIALAKLSKPPPLRWLGGAYLWVIRGTPLLLQIIGIWLIFPQEWWAIIEGILPDGKYTPSFEFFCGVIALSANVGAYNSECVRAGILAVPHGQIEAARALGLTPIQSFFDITMPQSMRVALPALANNLASLVKDSSLASAISVVELTKVAQRIQAQSYEPIPVFITSALIYLILTTAFTTITNAIELKLDVGRKS